MSNVENANVKEYLAQYKKKDIIFVPNPGNLGDDIIAHSTIDIFKELDISYTLSHSNEIHENKILIYGGGGNYIPRYNHCRNFLLNNHENNEIIVLPQTVLNSKDSLSKLSSNVTIFCRELRSYRHVRKIISKTLLAPDMSFLLKIDDEYKDRKNLGFHMECFRTDKESTIVPKPWINSDIPLVLKLRWETPETHYEGYKENFVNSQIPEYNIMRGSYSLINHVSLFDTISTNRLHVAILGALLNKKVRLYANNYWKNLEVYKYSIKKQYKNVKFIK